MITLRHSTRRAILRVRLIDRIQARDFTETVTPVVESLCLRHGRIDFLVIDVRRFAGWGALGAFAAQIRFLRRCGRSIARVAVLGPRAWAGAVPAIARLFVVAEVRAFTPREGRGLREWIRAEAPLSARVRSDSPPRSCG
jgi:hypothetical protein